MNQTKQLKLTTPIIIYLSIYLSIVGWPTIVETQSEVLFSLAFKV